MEKEALVAKLSLKLFGRCAELSEVDVAECEAETALGEGVSGSETDAGVSQQVKGSVGSQTSEASEICELISPRAGALSKARARCVSGLASATDSWSESTHAAPVMTATPPEASAFEAFVLLAAGSGMADDGLEEAVEGEAGEIGAGRARLGSTRGDSPAVSSPAAQLHSQFPSGTPDETSKASRVC